MSLIESTKVVTGTISYGASGAAGLHAGIAASPDVCLDLKERRDDCPCDDSSSEGDTSTSTLHYMEKGGSPCSIEGRKETLAIEEYTVSKQRRQRDRVSFSVAQIRHYGITIGDHPLTNLYPLTLDWSYNPTDQILSVEEYERLRGDRPPHRTVPASRGIRAPRMSVNQRIERLVDVTGMSGRELFALERRRQTIAQEESFYGVRGNNR